MRHESIAYSQDIIEHDADLTRYAISPSIYLSQESATKMYFPFPKMTVGAFFPAITTQTVGPNSSLPQHAT